MLDKCFPSQFHLPKRVSAIDLGKTQEIPKDLNKNSRTGKPYHNAVTNDPLSLHYNDI